MGSAKFVGPKTLRTRTISETQGLMKALIAPEDGRVPGFTVIGAEACEVMAVAHRMRDFLAKVVH